MWQGLRLLLSSLEFTYDMSGYWKYRSPHKPFYEVMKNSILEVEREVEVQRNLEANKRSPTHYQV